MNFAILMSAALARHGRRFRDHNRIGCRTLARHFLYSRSFAFIRGLLLCAFCASASAGDFYFGFWDSANNPQPLRGLLLYPLQANSVNPNGGFTTADYLPYYTGTNGTVICSNLIGETYMGVFIGTTTNTTNYFTLPQTNNVNQGGTLQYASNFVSNGYVIIGSSIPAYSEVQSDARFYPKNSNPSNYVSGGPFVAEFNGGSTNESVTNATFFGTLVGGNSTNLTLPDYSRIYLSSFEVAAVNGEYMLNTNATLPQGLWTNVNNNGYSISNYNWQGTQLAQDLAGYCYNAVYPLAFGIQKANLIYYELAYANNAFPDNGAGNVGAGLWGTNNGSASVSSGVMYFGTNAPVSINSLMKATNFYSPVVSTLFTANIAANADNPSQMVVAQGVSDSGTPFTLSSFGAQLVANQGYGSWFTNGTLDLWGYSQANTTNWDCGQINFHANGKRFAIIRGRANDGVGSGGFLDLLSVNPAVTFFHSSSLGWVTVGPQVDTSGASEPLPKAPIELSSNTICDSGLTVSGVTTSSFASPLPGLNQLLNIQTNSVGPHGYTLKFGGGIITNAVQY